MNQQAIVLIPLREGLSRLLRGKSAYYDAIRPESPRHDPDLPLTVAVGNAPNSPRAFIAAEVDTYLEKVVSRARTPETATAKSEAGARKLVSTRKSSRAANQGE